MADLHTAHLENEKVKKQLTDALAEHKLSAVNKDQVKPVNFEFPFWSKTHYKLMKENDLC